ncbi:MAG TPA: helix-turn-helix domain-containing protein [Propionibacteriaceae bacterium]|nr:helix-turn-helix domain-containing protein [Propionibacteriaceae bacterium]
MLNGPGEAAGHFGTKLRLLREQAGLTQEELAERAGVTTHAISALERGTRTRPYPHTVRSLADALGVSDVQRSSLIASVPSRRGARSAVDQPVQPPAPVTTGLGRARLVVPPTRLYGREADVAALAGLARAGSRLVTITGPGGVGKTRLAAAVCEQLAADYPDGTVPIALASIADSAGVVATIARALNVLGGDGPDALELVAGHLQSLRLLLVLDNFEHLLSAAADVGRLVSMCPRLTVLVASRSPLRVRGETEYGAAPLAVPAGEVSTTAELGESASGALVLDRARAVSPRLELAPDDVRALGELCRRLAGIPLAIELATARLRLLTPQALLDRLYDAGSSLGARDLPERQRTMRATLDWSYGLLSPEQQTLFRLLGVFRGGATLEAIEEVAAAAGGVAATEVIGLLELLVDQSLVVVRTGPDGSQRYDMLEPVAQYSRSLLIGAEARAAGQAHARAYLAMARRAADGYERADQVLWLARTETEEANLLVAIERSVDTGDGDTAGGIVWAMWLFWWLRGQLNLGWRRAEQCLALSLSPAVRSRVHLTAATMSYAAGDLVVSAEHWGSAFRLGAEQHDAEVACKGRAGTGLAALSSGDLGSAGRLFREALPLGVEAGESGVWLRSLVHVWLGTVLLLEGDSSAALAEIERGHRLARSRGDRLSTYVALYNLAQAAITGGDYRAARGYLDEGIELSDQTQDLANLAYFLDALAVVEAAEKAADKVAVLLGAAQALRETVGANVYGYYLPDERLRQQAEHAARVALSDDGFDDAVDTGRALDPAQIVRFALDGRSEVASVQR